MNSNTSEVGLGQDGRFFGPWPGRVRMVDPTGLSRVKVEVPAVSSHMLPNWAQLRGSNWGLTEGITLTPEIGTEVWVTFLGGDPNFPFWEPGPTTAINRPASMGRPGLRSLETKLWLVEVDDTTGMMTITDKARMNKLTLTAVGVAMLAATLQVHLGGEGLTPLDGVVTRMCLCSLTGAPHPDASTAVLARKV